MSDSLYTHLKALPLYELLQQPEATITALARRLDSGARCFLVSAYQMKDLIISFTK